VLTSRKAVTKYLPISLATHNLAEKFKKNKRDGLGDGDLDLFSTDRTFHDLFFMILVTQKK